MRGQRLGRGVALYRLLWLNGLWLFCDLQLWFNLGYLRLADSIFSRRTEEYDEQVKLLYNFMKSYPEQLDVKRIDSSLRMLREEGNNRLARKVLELSCKKISALYNEDAKAAERFENEITSLKV